MVQLPSYQSIENEPPQYENEDSDNNESQLPQYMSLNYRSKKITYKNNIYDVIYKHKFLNIIKFNGYLNLSISLIYLLIFWRNSYQLCNEIMSNIIILNSISQIFNSFINTNYLVYNIIKKYDEHNGIFQIIALNDFINFVLLILFVKGLTSDDIKECQYNYVYYTYLLFHLLYVFNIVIYICFNKYLHIIRYHEI